jgi:hypothetical protein
MYTEYFLIGMIKNSFFSIFICGKGAAELKTKLMVFEIDKNHSVENFLCEYPLEESVRPAYLVFLSLQSGVAVRL